MVYTSNKREGQPRDVPWAYSLRSLTALGTSLGKPMPCLAQMRRVLHSHCWCQTKLARVSPKCVDACLGSVGNMQFAKLQVTALFACVIRDTLETL